MNYPVVFGLASLCAMASGQAADVDPQTPEPLGVVEVIGATDARLPPGADVLDIDAIQWTAATSPPRSTCCPA